MNTRRLRTAHPLVTPAILILVALSLAGCAAQVANLPTRPLTAPSLVHCHHGTGHIAGAVPWILGGTCCCSPTKAMFAIHQTEETVPGDMTYEAYVKLYADRGILTGPEHAGCNNRCAAGPHVVLGGKCMAAPTPGTQNYEEVSQGGRSASQLPTGKH